MELGLPISWSVVQDHDGTMELDSTVDVGTTVTLRLPSQYSDPYQPGLCLICHGK